MKIHIFRKIVEDINGQKVRTINGISYVVIEFIFLRGVTPEIAYCAVETSKLSTDFFELNPEEIQII